MPFPLAAPALGLVAGAAVGLRWPLTPLPFVAAVVVGWLALARYAVRVRRRPLLWLAVAGMAAGGGQGLAVRAWARAWRPTLRVVFESVVRDERREAVLSQRALPEEPSAPVVISGVLRTDAALTGTGTASLAVDVEWVGRPGAGQWRGGADINPVRGGVLLTVLGTLAPERLDDWRAGRRIRAPADLRRVARYLDPGVPDQERALARRGITLVGTIKSAALVEVVAPGSALAEAAAAARAFARRAVDSGVGVWSPRAAAVVNAIIIGDRTGLDDDVQRRLQEAGTYHVIAISGGNIAILAGLTLALFRICGMLGRTAMLSAAVGLIAYGCIVGGGASVTRAVLMAVVYFLARAWDLRGPPLQTLLLAAALMVVADPLSVADVGALLTFGATAGIVIAAPMAPLVRLPHLARGAAALFVASLAAETALLPVAATSFSRVTVAGLVLNFAAIPLMGVAQLAGMAVVPLYPVSPTLARAAGWAAYVGAEGLIRSADLVAVAPWSTWRVAPPSGWVSAVYYLGLAAVAWQARRRVDSRLSPVSSPRGVAAVGAARVCAIAAGLWIAFAPASGWDGGDGRLHALFIDVGQGDAALVTLPHGSSLLIDAGGLSSGSSFDVGDRIVGPVLRHEGVARLAAMVLTHGDADHVGGARTVLREFRPFDVWDGVPVPPSKAMRELREAAAASRVRWTTVQRTDTAMLDEVTITVQHPPRPDWERQDVRNDDSIVLELRWRDVSFVFTGDIGREVESAMAGQFARVPLRVVKVPHHGSATSSSASFLSALHPDVAVVSVGRSNPFGHPSAPVLQRYRDVRTAVFRTDQDGAVRIDTDGASLDVHTFTGRTLHVAP